MAKGKRKELTPANVYARIRPFDASGKSLAVCCDDGKLRFVDVESRALGHETPGHNDPVSAAVFDRKGKYLVTAGADCTFRLFC